MSFIKTEQIGPVLALTLNRPEKKNAITQEMYQTLATAAGALFIRSYERGERVHLAMIARGYQGDLPKEAAVPNHLKYWMIALCVPALALVIALLS